MRHYDIGEVVWNSDDYCEELDQHLHGMVQDGGACEIWASEYRENDGGGAYGVDEEVCVRITKFFKDKDITKFLLVP